MSGRLGGALVEGLIRGGVRRVVLSPGSRSTPLVLAFAERREVRRKVVLDERSAAFYALGLADRTKEPVALLCTSGSAPAHYLPAVIEAWYRKVPLVILSADRPPELRDCGAGQTIEQTRLFSSYVRWGADLAVEETPGGARHVFASARRACREALATCGGPVHLNVPLREPFFPFKTDLAGLVSQPEDKPVLRWAESDWSALRKIERGIILAGAVAPADPEAWAEGLFRISDHLGWPVLCDVLNPGRVAPGAVERVVSQYELLFRGGADFLETLDLRPDAVLQVGPLPTAKPVREWLATFEGLCWQWSATPEDLDPSRRGGAWIAGSPEDMQDDAPSRAESAPDIYRAQWLAAERQAVDIAQKALGQLPDTFEGNVYRCLAETVPSGTQVFLGNSMPVRDAERYWFPGTGSRTRLFANRGANGIDGLVSTAVGLAEDGPPTVAVIGDLAFLHDAGGLRLANGFSGSLTLVVIENGGGRIFEHLPVRQRDDVFAECFLTPQTVDSAKLCEAHEVAWSRVRCGEDLRTALHASGAPGIRILFVETDPGADIRCREEIFSSQASALH